MCAELAYELKLDTARTVDTSKLAVVQISLKNLKTRHSTKVSFFQNKKVRML